MKRILFILLGLLPLLGWAQPKSTAPLSPAESRARLQQLGDSLRKCSKSSSGTTKNHALKNKIRVDTRDTRR